MASLPAGLPGPVRRRPDRPEALLCAARRDRRRRRRVGDADPGAGDHRRPVGQRRGDVVGARPAATGAITGAIAAPARRELSDDAVATAVLIKEETGTLVEHRHDADVDRRRFRRLLARLRARPRRSRRPLHRPRRDRGRRDVWGTAEPGEAIMDGTPAATPLSLDASSSGPRTGPERASRPRAVADRRAASEPTPTDAPAERRATADATAEPSPTPTPTPTAAPTRAPPTPTPASDARAHARARRRRRRRRRPLADADADPDPDPDANPNADPHADADADAEPEPVAVAVALAVAERRHRRRRRRRRRPRRSGALTGTLTYNEPAPLSAEARALVVLVEGAGRPTAGSIVASTLLTDFGQKPIPFELPYSQREHRPEHRPTRSSATIVDGDRVWTTSSGTPVITKGNPSERPRPRPDLPGRPRQGQRHRRDQRRRHRADRDGVLGGGHRRPLQ